MPDCNSFYAPQSLLRRLQRRFNGILCQYWRICRQLWIALILGSLLPFLGQWVLDIFAHPGIIGLPEIARYPPVRLVLGIPWPITATTVVLIVLSIIAAWQAHRDQWYYKVLDNSAQTYRAVRRSGYRGIAAQLRGSGQSAGTRAQSEPQLIDRGIEVFDDQLYTERRAALQAFEAFVNQCRQRIFLVVGGGGAGKSTFLLHRMAETADALRSRERRMGPHPSVFINCKLDPITNQTPLDTVIERKLGDMGMGLIQVLTSVVRSRHDRAFVIFVDAINENSAGPGDDINVHLTNFASQYLHDGAFDLYLCVSIRKTYWDEESRRRADDPNNPALGWLEYVYRPEYDVSSRIGWTRGAETVSVLLEEFEPEEFDVAYKHYQQVYNIRGAIQDERTRRICSNPLMLQTFCVTFRDQDIADLDVIRNLVRDLDIFDAYAKGGLARVARQVGIVTDEPIRNGETLAQRAIRGLLLELALGMVDRGRQFLADDEVYDIASDRAEEALIVQRTRIDNTGALYDPGSVLRALLDEGIVLEKGIGVTSDTGNFSGGVRFVTERYLEYSIGRALARRWRLEGFSRDQIVADFRVQMARHNKLTEQGFDNLRQGLGIAILVAEGDENLPPKIHMDLLDVLARDENFDWNQLACRIVQQTRTLNAPSPSYTSEHVAEVEELLKILDGLAKKNDFVLRWDIERALLHAVAIGEGQLVFRHLREWCAPAAPFSQRLFSAECLGYLFKQRADYQEEALAAVRQVVESSSELDFWILRSFVFSLGTMLDTLEDTPVLQEVYA